jgi:hypothetical protein
MQAAGLHAGQPVGLDDMDAAGVALAEEALAVLGGGGGGYRPDAPA